MQVMKERDDSQPLSGTIQLDDVYWGGEHHGGSRGRGSQNKIPFVAAISTNDKGNLVAMNMNVVKGFRLSEISSWSQQHLQPGSRVISDGLACFSAVKVAGVPTRKHCNRRRISKCDQRRVYLGKHYDR